MAEKQEANDLTIFLVGQLHNLCKATQWPTRYCHRRLRHSDGRIERWLRFGKEEAKPSEVETSEQEPLKEKISEAKQSEDELSGAIEGYYRTISDIYCKAEVRPISRLSH